MHRRELNNANEVKRMADFLGHSNNLITLSLRYSPIIAFPLYTARTGV